MPIDHPLYTAHATVTGGREGRATSPDGALDLKLSLPKALGGPGGDGTNPEQLFAAGYAACFTGALRRIAGEMKLRLPQDVRVDGAVTLGPLAGQHGAFGIAVELTVHLPELERDRAEALLQAAHRICPYSNATRGNVDVALRLA